ncbi:MAG: DUF1566 domain-containing protein [Nitrospinales bacterium]
MKSKKIIFSGNPFIGLSAFTVLVCFWVALTCTFVSAEGASTVTIKWSSDKRFSDNGDKTITDTKTGLMWLKEDAYLHTGHWMNWEEVFVYVDKLNHEGFAGYHDWLVPSTEELLTLFDPDKFNSAQVGREMNIRIDPIFAKNGSGAHWSTKTNGHHNAFGVIYNDGMVFSSSKNSRARKSVRAVRYINP